MQVSNESASVLTLPRDVWSIIVKFIYLYDAVFVRATSKWFNQLCKEFRPFPRFHVLDQDECMTYLVENGFISLLDYVKDVLHFSWTSRQCSTAIKSGQVDVLRHLHFNGCPFNLQTSLVECTMGTCCFDMIKYLHENGADLVIASQKYPLMSKMITKGHIECIKYAMQNGCQDRSVDTVPSIECLDFLIENNFDWKGVNSRRKNSQNICEAAAASGNLELLQYAHQKGAPMRRSVYYAAEAGHIKCLKFIIENNRIAGLSKLVISDIECFKYFLEKFGVDEVKEIFAWGEPEHRSMEYIKYALDSGISLPNDDDENGYIYSILEMAGQSVPMLEFLIDRIPQSKRGNLYQSCARNENIEGLKWLIERKIEFSLADSLPLVLLNAIYQKNLELFKFVWENFPHPESSAEWQRTINEIIPQSATPEMMNYLYEQGVKWESKHLTAASFNLPNMAYLTRIGCKWEDNHCYTIKSNVTCVKYAREHGCTNFRT